MHTGDSRGRSILEILFDVAPPIAQLFVAAFHLSPAGRRSRFYSAKKRKKGGEGEKKNYGAPINLISTEKFSIRWPFPDFSWFVGGKNGPSFSTVHHQNGRYILWPISTEINGNVSRIGDKIVLLDLGQDFFFFSSIHFWKFSIYISWKTKKIAELNKKIVSILIFGRFNHLSFRCFVS